MTLTTEIRINWPVPAIALLDHVTRVAGGDPLTVRRRVSDYDGGTYNCAGQGLMTLAGVKFSEKPDVGDPAEGLHAPPALVVLSIDNPYGFGDQNRGRWVQANVILPAVVEWLDAQRVPRHMWWWEDETAGTYHPGTEDVSRLDQPGERDTWSAPVASR